MSKPIVYFTKEVTGEALIKLYEKLGVNLKGNVACKLHSGEKGNQNFVRPEFVKPIIDKVNGTVVECNTAYAGSRSTTKKHLKTFEAHGWSKYFNVDLMDKDGDFVIDIPNGKVIKQDYVGADLKNYDSMLVLSHFKGHPMGGFGGAIKQLSIGVASARGKTYIHSAGKQLRRLMNWLRCPPQELFLESMADAACGVHNYFNGNIVYINMMVNMSVDCDCCSVAEDPCLKDIGCLISTDPIAIDQACIDLVLASKDEVGKEHFMKRVNSRKGLHTLEAASELGFGSREYDLVSID